MKFLLHCKKLLASQKIIHRRSRNNGHEVNLRAYSFLRYALNMSVNKPHVIEYHNSV